MTPEAAQKRIEDLARQIEHHDRRYYLEAEPEISDRAYDELYQELTVTPTSEVVFLRMVPLIGG